MKKKLFVTLLITLSTLFFSFACANAEENINVILNDEAVTFDTAPIMENDRILVPIRAIAEKMEFDVDWDQDTETVTLENFNTILKIRIDNYKIRRQFKFMPENYFENFSAEEKQRMLDSYNVSIDVPAKVINDRTYLPLRAVTESFGCEVDWKQDSQTAEIFYAHTYGKEVAFEDEGMACLTRLKIIESDFASNDNNNALSMSFSILKDNDLLNKLSEIKIHEGDLQNITSIGSPIDTLPTIYSIEDIKKFPNLKTIELPDQQITDLSPLSYKKEWNNLYLSRNPITDFSVIKEITPNSIALSSPIFGNLGWSVSTNYPYKLYIETAEKIISEYQKVVDNYINEDMSRKEKIIAINDWIQENIKYDYNHAHENEIIRTLEKKYENVNQSSIFTNIMLTHYGTCEDYATMFKTFCNMLDIPCIYLSGTAYGTVDGINYEWGNHAWNVVELDDGKLYHVDTTWDLLFIDEDELRTDYDHTWDEDDIDFNSKYIELRSANF